MLTRTVKIGYEFQRIGLTKEELDEAMQKLLEHNYRELKRIGNFLTEKGYNPKNEATALTMQILADKQLMRTFTVVANALDEKLFNMRSKSKKPFTKGEQKEIKKKVEEGFKKKDTPEGESLIQKAFDKAQEQEQNERS